MEKTVEVTPTSTLLAHASLTHRDTQIRGSRHMRCGRRGYFRLYFVFSAVTSRRKATPGRDGIALEFEETETFVGRGFVHRYTRERACQLEYAVR